MIHKYCCRRCMKEIKRIEESNSFIEIIEGMILDPDIFTLCDSCYAALFSKFMQPNDWKFTYIGGNTNEEEQKQ